MMNSSGNETFPEEFLFCPSVAAFPFGNQFKAASIQAKHAASFPIILTILNLRIVASAAASFIAMSWATLATKMGVEIMRQILFMAALLAGAGCQALGDAKCHNEKEPCRKPRLAGLLNHFHSDCEPKKPCDAPRAPAAPPPKAPPPVQEVETQRAPAIAQDILLIPKTVYIPYAPQTPTAPVRLSSLPPTAPAPAAPGPQAPAPQAPGPQAPAPQAPGPQVPCDVTYQMLDICKKLNERLDCLERKYSDRIVCPPTQVCPPRLIVPNFPPTGLLRHFPLLRRPLIPQCETLQPCEPTPIPTPMSLPTPPTPPPPPTGRTTAPEITLPIPGGASAPERIMSMPRPAEVTPMP